MCMVEDSEPWEFHSENLRTAKKLSKCDECYRAIGCGEKYYYSSGKCDGHFQVFRTCLHCAGARGFLRSVCGGWMYSGVLEDLQEHRDEVRGDVKVGLIRLIVGMRRKWKRHDGAMMPVPDGAAIGKRAYA